MKNKVLAVVAHPDDEILGVGGTLIKHVQNGDEVQILILSDGETSRGEVADISKRKKQAQKVAEKIGASQIFFEQYTDNSFDSIPLLKITQSVEKVVYQEKPSIIYTHHAHDLNIDHRITMQAVMTTCRPQPDFFVKNIYTFETPSSTEWQEKTADNTFLPNVYTDISRTVDQKLETLEIYADELRDYPHPRSIEAIQKLAEYRGIEVGKKFCEAFQLVREIN